MPSPLPIAFIFHDADFRHAAMFVADAMPSLAFAAPGI